ncbi:MAG: DUF2249 domain-containing protein [Bdellovibrionales bacterium]|jgi:hypothetical protein|nr:DUF2249 domain-containing protein [Bdellovibrionales bacterium]MBT3526634.1 DUF2249 domain-containing protein [Bdellovibrionales bacterium]MBT7667986.1 DUF2249 domain-containing protein [Bdellovibrionales bacterium]MBT7766241.1 DUF2249 domain-containing protein [Bdellovibrionales bacterium]
MTKMERSEVLCDVSDLPAPLPLETIQIQLNQLSVDQYLKIVHRFRPKLLFPILQQRSFAYLLKEHRQDGLIEIYVWHQENRELSQLIRGES